VWFLESSVEWGSRLKPSSRRDVEACGEYSGERTGEACDGRLVMAEDWLERIAVGECEGECQSECEIWVWSCLDVTADVALRDVNLWGCREGHRGLRFMLPKHAESAPVSPRRARHLINKQHTLE
jgi:hypothetical protein